MHDPVELLDPRNLRPVGYRPSEAILPTQYAPDIGSVHLRHDWAASTEGDVVEWRADESNDPMATSRAHQQCRQLGCLRGRSSCVVMVEELAHMSSCGRSSRVRLLEPSYIARRRDSLDQTPQLRGRSGCSNTSAKFIVIRRGEGRRPGIRRKAGEHCS
jgi:hypothetical protein